MRNAYRGQYDGTTASALPKAVTWSGKPPNIAAGHPTGPAIVLEGHVKGSQLGLNGLNFFTAAVQAGFGPFVAVWLAMNGWNLRDLGLALSIGTFAALVCQLPGGMLVDQFHNKHVSAAGALVALGLSALMLSLAPTHLVVWGAQVLHGLASCVMTPAIAALTLSVCGHEAFGERLGQNTRFQALGNATAAALLGFAASTVSQRSVFQATAALAVPALLMLPLIRDRHQSAAPHPATRAPDERTHRWHHLFGEPSLHVFALAVVLFQLANAALLPLALNGLTHRGGAPGYIVSATVVVPQVVAAMIAPRAGGLTERIGRRPVLLLGFAAVPLRAVLLAIFPDALPLIVIQALDGISAAVFGVMLPLIAADLTTKTGFLNMAIGALGLAAGIGATVSTFVAGWIGQLVGEPLTYVALAGTGALSVVVLWLGMPETNPAMPGVSPLVPAQ